MSTNNMEGARSSQTIMDRGRKMPFCRNILQKGVCTTPNCKYNHSVSDVEGYRAVEDFFMSENLRHELAVKRRTRLNPHNLGDQYSAETRAGKYHTVIQLSKKPNQRMLGYTTCAYRGVSPKDGHVYFMRRMDCFHIASRIPRSENATTWRMYVHCNTTRLVDVFTATRFLNGEASPVFFVYDFHPNAVSLENYILQTQKPAIPENLIWSIASQLALAMRAAHAGGLSMSLQIGSIIIIGNGRVKVTDVGIGDCLQITSTVQNDVLLYGLVLLSLLLKEVNVTYRDVKKMSRGYSSQLQMFIARLFFPSAEGGFADSNVICHFLTSQIMREYETKSLMMEKYENDLELEIENGRLLRLIAKLNFVIDRPANRSNPNWSETGDMYLLRLLNDYIFHKVDDEGRIVLDFGHVINTLNKLDVGSPERVMLTSRDSQNVLIVTYADLKDVAEKAFAEMVREANTNDIA